VRYEDLQIETVGTLTRALAFGRHVATDDAISRAVAFSDFALLQKQEREKGFHEGPRPSPNGRFFRQGTAGGWRNELSAAQAGAIEAAHGDMMLRLGYELSGMHQSRVARRE
jgi:aryl sulfotransferase